MTRHSIGMVLVVAAAFAAAGCGGGDGGGGGDGEAATGACAQAKADLNLSVSTRDRLFVDQRIKEATAACVEEYDEPGVVEECSAARADLEAAAAEESPPPDLDARVESAVAACVGTTITSTIPAP